MKFLPSPKFSSDRLITIGRRFGRLCTREGTGAQHYNDRIAAAVRRLVQRSGEAKQAEFEVDAARDSAMQVNMALGDAVRTAFERCKQHDRENPTEPVALKVFPNGTFFQIFRSTRAREMEQVRDLSCMIKALGEASPLAPVAQALDAAVAVMDRANAELLAKNRAYDDFATQENLARIFFVNEYKATYYDAAVKRGQRNARSLFPVISVRKERREPPAGQGGAEDAVPDVPELKAA
jgi:hypothetical protein